MDEELKRFIEEQLAKTLEERDSKFRDAERIKDIAQKQYEIKRQLLEGLDKLIKDGKKVIYPQRKEEWVAHVMDCVEGRKVASLEQLNKSVEIIRDLNAGKPFDEATKGIDENDWQDTEPIYGTVLRFAKNGVDFYREKSGYYLWVRLRGSKQQRMAMEDEINNIKLQNQKYEEELSNDRGLGD